MSRQTRKARGPKDKADDLFSLIIRSRGYCEACGSTSWLQCAHIMSRRFSNTRCVEANAVCLCAKCHHRFTDHPVEFGLWVIEHIGADEYERLRELRESNVKVRWPDVLEQLKARAAELEVAA